MNANIQESCYVLRDERGWFVIGDFQYTNVIMSATFYQNIEDARAYRTKFKEYWTIHVVTCELLPL